MNFRGFNNLQQQSIVILVCLVLISQVLFPLQLHTKVVQTASGKTVVVCTLQGHGGSDAGHEGHQMDMAQAEDAQASPAVKFSQLLSTATPLSILPAIPADDFAGTEVVTLQQLQPVQIRHRRFSIRAPPAILVS